MKKFVALACGLALSATLFTTACTGLMGGGSDAVAIESVSAPVTIEKIEDGEIVLYIQVTITYSDEDIAPTVIEIPQGKKGDEGNGIQGIRVLENDEENDITKLEITYTKQDSEIIDVPFGTYITGVEPVIDEETGLTEELIFNFSNDTLDPVILDIYHGKDGADGKDGATWYSQEGDPNLAEEPFGVEGDLYLDTLTQDIYKNTAEGWVLLTNIKGEQGEEGLTIVDIRCEFDSTSNQYLITLVYNDETEQVINPINNQNAWLSGAGNPGPFDGNVGDFWINTSAGIVYRKVAGIGWDYSNPVLDFSKYSTETHTVTFIRDANSDVVDELEITHGTYFALSDHQMPVPSRSGYKFLGWFTSADANDVNAGQLTDLTPIMGDLIVYARWESLPEVEEEAE
ncbi:MAG: hypothetical protein E7370_00190 [Clostridiales bacterium]|nr:hypothetical protein [Clostridiales bacterium]